MFARVSVANTCGLGACDKRYDQFDWHSRCWTLSVKNRHRTIREANADEHEEIIREDKEKMRDSPEEWQAEVAAFLPYADKTVAKAAKNDLKSYAQSYNVAENFDQQVDRSEDLIFNRRHYLRHFKKWEHSDDETYVEEGNKSFNKMHEDQEGAEDDSTESHIAVPNPKKKRVRDTGTRTSTGSRMQGQISDESHQAFFNRTNRKMGMSPSTEVPEDAADEPPRKKGSS